MIVCLSLHFSVLSQHFDIHDNYSNLFLIQRISQLQESSNNKELRLRVFVEGGGCSGFQYKFTMEDTPPDDGT